MTQPGGDREPNPKVLLPVEMLRRLTRFELREAALKEKAQELEEMSRRLHSIAQDLSFSYHSRFADINVDSVPYYHDQTSVAASTGIAPLPLGSTRVTPVSHLGSAPIPNGAIPLGSAPLTVSVAPIPGSSATLAPFPRPPDPSVIPVPIPKGPAPSSVIPPARPGGIAPIPVPYESGAPVPVPAAYPPIPNPGGAPIPIPGPVPIPPSAAPIPGRGPPIPMPGDVPIPGMVPLPPISGAYPAQAYGFVGWPPVPVPGQSMIPYSSTSQATGPPIPGLYPPIPGPFHGPKHGSLADLKILLHYGKKRPKMPLFDNSEHGFHGLKISPVGWTKLSDHQLKVRFPNNVWMDVDFNFPTDIRRMCDLFGWFRPRRRPRGPNRYGRGRIRYRSKPNIDVPQSVQKLLNQMCEKDRSLTPFLFRQCLQHFFDSSSIDEQFFDDCVSSMKDPLFKPQFQNDNDDENDEMDNLMDGMDEKDEESTLKKVRMAMMKNYMDHSMHRLKMIEQCLPFDDTDSRPKFMDILEEDGYRYKFVEQLQQLREQVSNRIRKGRLYWDGFHTTIAPRWRFDDMTHLPESEQLWYFLSDIPGLRTRMDLFALRFDWLSELKCFCEEIRVLGLALSQLRESRAMKDLLSSVITTGNLLNFAADQRKALAFGIDLRQMMDFISLKKTSTKKSCLSDRRKFFRNGDLLSAMSMLDFVCESVLQKYADGMGTAMNGEKLITKDYFSGRLFGEELSSWNDATVNVLGLLPVMPSLIAQQRKAKSVITGLFDKMDELETRLNEMAKLNEDLADKLNDASEVDCFDELTLLKDRSDLVEESKESTEMHESLLERMKRFRKYRSHPAEQLDCFVNEFREWFVGMKRVMNEKVRDELLTGMLRNGVDTLEYFTFISPELNNYDNSMARSIQWTDPKMRLKCIHALSDFYCRMNEFLMAIKKSTRRICERDRMYLISEKKRQKDSVIHNRLKRFFANHLSKRDLQNRKQCQIDKMILQRTLTMNVLRMMLLKQKSGHRSASMEDDFPLVWKGGMRERRVQKHQMDPLKRAKMNDEIVKFDPQIKMEIVRYDLTIEQYSFLQYHLFRLKQKMQCLMDGSLSLVLNRRLCCVFAIIDRERWIDEAEHKSEEEHSPVMSLLLDSGLLSDGKTGESLLSVRGISSSMCNRDEIASFALSKQQSGLLLNSESLPMWEEVLMNGDLCSDVSCVFVSQMVPSDVMCLRECPCPLYCLSIARGKRKKGGSSIECELQRRMKSRLISLDELDRCKEEYSLTPGSLSLSKRELLEELVRVSKGIRVRMGECGPLKWLSLCHSDGSIMIKDSQLGCTLTYLDTSRIANVTLIVVGRSPHLRVELLCPRSILSVFCYDLDNLRLLSVLLDSSVK